MSKITLVKACLCLVTHFLCALFSYAQKPFITTWKVDTTSGIDSVLRITIPTTGSGYNYSISWENTADKTIHATILANTGSTTILFPAEGIYRVSISGDFPRIYFNDKGDRSKLLTVEQWGDIAWTSMQDAFGGCNLLTIPAKDAPDLRKVESMRRMFYNCRTLNSPIGHWNVSQVKDMALLFCYAVSFNQPIGNWDVSNVEDMSLMFQSASVFNQDLGNWDVSNVKSMYGLFYWPNVFNKDISKWDVSNVTTMSYMFLLNTAFNQDISSWDVSNVTKMNNMFERAVSFNQNLGNWDISKVTDMKDMFNYSKMSVANYDSTLIRWSKNQFLQKNVEVGGRSLAYCKADAERKKMISNFGWTFTGDSYNCNLTAYEETRFEQEWAVSPNPFVDRITMAVPVNGQARVELLDGTGTLVLTQTVDTAAPTIVVENRPPGVYFLKIHAQSKVQTFRLMKR